MRSISLSLRSRIPLCCLLGFALAAATPASAQILYNFTPAGQFAANFRSLNGATDSRATATQTTLSGNGIVTYNNTTGTGTSAGAIYLYDTTPGDTTTATQSGFSLEDGDSLTVSLGFTLPPNTTSASSSLGIYFASASDVNKNILALLSVDTDTDGAGPINPTTSTQEHFRLFTSGTPSSVAPGTLAASSPFFDGGVTDGSGTFATAAFTISIAGGAPTLSVVTAGGTGNQSLTLGASAFNWTDDTVVIFRWFDANAAAVSTALNIDNIQFTYTPVPEPSGALLLGPVLLLAVLRRRKPAPR